MRKITHAALVAAEPITNVVQTRIWARGSLGAGDIPADPQKPFILHGEQEAVPFREVRDTSTARSQFVQIGVYDELGDYTTIDTVLTEIRKAMLAVELQVVDGIRITYVEWQGQSPDLIDPDLQCSYRFGTFLLVYSR